MFAKTVALAQVSILDAIMSIEHPFAGARGSSMGVCILHRLPSSVVLMIASPEHSGPGWKRSETAILLVVVRSQSS